MCAREEKETEDMDAEHRDIFRGFLSMHAHKAHATEEPCAFLQFHAPHAPHDMELLRFTREDVLEALDPKHSELVRWLLEQMRTYTPHRQCIVGLFFDERTVLSEVLWRSDS